MDSHIKKFTHPFTSGLLTELAGHLTRAAKEVDPAKAQVRAKAVRNVLDGGLHLASTPIVARHRGRGQTARPPELPLAERTRRANELIEIKKGRELFVARRTKMREAISDLNKLR